MENVDKIYICDIIMLKDICWRYNMAKKARNIVIEGEYKGKGIACTAIRIFIVPKVFKTIDLNCESVESYQLVDEKTFSGGAGAAVARGLVGNAIAGGIGALAGVASTPQNDVYIVLINFKDGKKSLIEIDGKHFDILKQSLMYNVKL